LQTVRGLNYKDPAFTAWRDTTTNILDKFLGPDDNHSHRFQTLRFSGPIRILPFGSRVPRPGYISHEDAEAFRRSCETSDATLRAAIKHVEDFGVYVEEYKPTPAGRGRGKSSGGVSQNFHGAVNLNQAIATDSAVQRIGRVGNKTGTELKEILYLLQQSQDLTPRQVRQGVADVEALAVEVEKPEEKRNWTAVLECGQRVLDLAAKAADLGAKLGPHLPILVALVENAKHFLK
jgi:hypothetical protein